MSTQSDKEIVTQVIDAWDPLNLFPDAPPDEYYREIALIVKKLEAEDEVHMLAQSIKEIFDHSFEGVYYCSIDEVLAVARKILQRRDPSY